MRTAENNENGHMSLSVTPSVYLTVTSVLSRRARLTANLATEANRILESLFVTVEKKLIHD